MAALPTFLTDPNPQLYVEGFDDSVTLDFETTNKEKGSALNPDNRIVMAAWHGPEGMQYKWGGELDQHELLEACNKASFLIAHNAKFELQWLARCGYDIASRPVYCTMVAEWVIGGNRQWGKLASLDDCCERRGMPCKDTTVSKMIKAGVCPSDIPRSLLLRYGRMDVALTRGLFLRQLREMSSTRLLPIVYTRCLAIPVLADIETNGLHLDAERVEEEYDETLAEFTEVMGELNKLTGGINPKSPTQVATFVYGELGFSEKKDSRGRPIRNKPTKQFPDGLPKTDETTLLSLGANTPEQKKFLKLKKKQAHLSAALDKNLSMFVGACREQDGMIYAQLNQCTTKTHRLSSAGRSTYYEMFDDKKGCQFQNLPRVYKKLFSPRHEGWLIGEADGTTLEFGVAGHVGNDDKIRQEVRDGYDVHSFTQQVISGAGRKDITRTQAKAHTFKPLYGGVSGSKAERAYYKAFGEKYSDLKFTQDGWCITVGTTKMLETDWGMRFYWPNARWEGDWLNVKTTVYNIAIQSMATAEIVPIALVFFWYRTRDAEMLLVNTVHDSIEAEFPEHERELFEETAVQCFTEDVYNYLDKAYDVQFSVPLGVGMVIGHHWGEPLDGEDEIKIRVETPYYE